MVIPFAFVNIGADKLKIRLEISTIESLQCQIEGQARKEVSTKFDAARISGRIERLEAASAFHLHYMPKFMDNRREVVRLYGARITNEKATGSTFCWRCTEASTGACLKRDRAGSNIERAHDGQNVGAFPDTIDVRPARGDGRAIVPNRYFAVEASWNSVGLRAKP